ncbi:MAG TPA: bifunctional 2-polyprenyl-6-hydroxyphenol methylase/3-demethylubiquinol 3-O-methyltransferase UbiG [Candidatus Saccharimonadia bacterium]|nr:bifunctional 2-polyprenyl-6-hydroxyphenol methylase/3-demethylubiquinol 3-O-methyltransferase UbiG [Candidatus Saccharimonadia bacterium]
MSNVDPAEIRKFGQLAHRWWDPDGESRPLHDLNPVRVGYVRERVVLAGARVLDVGCGGGLLSEALAREGASVTGIDLSPDVLAVARMHLHESGASVDYREASAEALAAEQPGSFDVVTCMEVLEHVPDPAALLAACAALLKPAGKLFASTLNRTARSFALAIVGAEYVLGLLPRGTHDYSRFIRPSELSRMLRGAGMSVDDVRGIAYSPLTRRAALTGDCSMNYLVCATLPA